MLTLHNKDFTTKYGTINTTIEAFVEEERNGLFELSFIMLNTDSLFNYVKEDNIVVANANDTLLNQKFRIYMTRKLMNNRVEVFARHISFDLMYDYIDNISFENQSCEYALNMLFRNSSFSKHYKGYSDIINAQDYNMSMANILEAIGGKEGSIIDTFGTGAELLRDNENIHILNKRGHDNSVSIEYKKNLTGFELEEDTTELITRILPCAKYNDEEGNEITVKASYVDSPLIANYSHPFIKAIDYSDKFDDENIPTIDKLRVLAELEYKNNKVDIPKQNFKIEFIPLSKCVGYEGLSDNINLCDTVVIKDTRYNINTQAKVIKATYNVLKNRYESMELGEPKTSLGDIIGNNNSTKGEKGDKGDKGEPGKDGSIGDFPNSLPSTPVVTAKVYGFANIEISWTFENQVYYQYELYASKEVDFIPNTFNLIHQGQTSSYLYQAKPNETWYFKVCCVNSHGERTDFGASYATTSKIDDLSNYVSEMAIDEALIGTLSLDRGWVGSLKGNYIDAKQLSVTDGNGKRTLDIDSFGNVNLDVNSLKISSSNVATENYANAQAANSLNSAKTHANSAANAAQTRAVNTAKSYTDTKISDTKAELKVTTDSITSRVEETISAFSDNLLLNSNFTDTKKDNYWGNWQVDELYLQGNIVGFPVGEGIGIHSNQHEGCTINSHNVQAKTGDAFTVSGTYRMEPKVGLMKVMIRAYQGDHATWHDYFVDIANDGTDTVKTFSETFKIQVENVHAVNVILWNITPTTISDAKRIFFNRIKLERGDTKTDWSDHPLKYSHYTKSEIQQKVDSVEYKFQQSGGYNLLYNGDLKNGFTHWSINNPGNLALETGLSCPTGRGVAIYSGIGQTAYVSQLVNLDGGVDSYTCSCYMYCSEGQNGATNPYYGLYGEVYFTDGTIDYYSASVSMLGAWQKVYFTFKKPHNKTFRTAAIFGYARDTTKAVYFSQFMLEKGEVPREWSPNPNEIYDGITRIDKDGVQVMHSDGSSSRMNSREFYATNQNGIKTFSTRRGGLWGYNISDGSVNYTVTTTKMQNSGAKGMSIISSNNNASYLTIGTSDEFATDTDTVNTTPNMVIVGKTFGDTVWGNTIGTHFINKSVHTWTDTIMHSALLLDSGSSYYHLIANMTGGKLGLYGDNGVNIGVRAGNSNISNFMLTEDSSNAYGYFSVYGNWYFNNYTAYNLKTANSLEAQSQRLRNYQAENKELNNLYGSFSFYDNEFTYTNATSHIIPYGEFELLIEIPQILSENMQNEYHINISKHSFGDYRIKEKNNYYFIIETDRVEDFSFTYQIVGKLIEKARNNSVIANNSINFDNEDYKEPIELTIENEINKDLLG